jgi:hypothetical protein
MRRSRICENERQHQHVKSLSIMNTDDALCIITHHEV